MSSGNGHEHEHEHEHEREHKKKRANKHGNRKTAYIAVICILAVVIIIQACLLGYLLLSGEVVDLPGPPLSDFINVMDKGAIGDGRTDDSKAITLAFNEAQSKGRDLYFPKGTYNFNGLNLTARQNLRIFGDGENTILYKPGTLNAYGNIALENLSIYKETGIFVFLRLEKYVDVLVDRVKFYNNLDAATDCRLVYAGVNVKNTNTGVNSVTFTNNNVSKCYSALQLKCEVKSGLVENNTITNLGDPNVHMAICGIALGNVDTANGWVEAENITIRNNKISGLFTPDNELKITESVFSIIVIGNHVDIYDNYIENQRTGAGIYCKANNVRIAGNTLRNAGQRSSILVKCEVADDDGSITVIENNNIESSIDRDGSIRVHTAGFLIRNNTIRQLENKDGILASTAAISHNTTPARNGVIEGNTIYTESRLGIMLQAVDGNVYVRNNTITQNVVKPAIYDLSAMVNVRDASSTSVVNIYDNTLTMDRGLYMLQCASTNRDGSIITFENNIITALENEQYLFSPYNMTLNLIGNNITVKRNTSLNAGIQRNGLISAVHTSVLSRIENNVINYNGDGAASMFLMRSPFSMTGNRISFSPESNFGTVVNYLPTANVAPANGAVSTVSDNDVGNIADTYLGKYSAHIDYLVSLNTGATITYPQLNIKENKVLVNLRLVGKNSATADIRTAGSIALERNAVFSARFLGEDALIVNGAQNKPTSRITLHLNMPLASVIDNALIEAEEAARKEAERLAAEAERLAAEQAAAEAAAKAEAEEAARLAAEAEEAARLAAEAEEAARLAEEEEARRAAEEEAARLAAEAEEAARLAAEAEEAARLAAEEAERLAAMQKAAEEAEAAARAEAEEAARIAAEQEAARAAAEEEERLAAERAAAAEEEARRAAEEAERLAQEEEARLAAEEAARQAAEEEANRLAKEEADRLAAEAAAKQAEADANENAVLPQNPNDFTYFTTKDGYLVLQFLTDVACASNKCVTIDGKTYNTSQYDKNSIIVNVKTNTGQLNNSFRVTAQVIFPTIDSKRVQALTKTFTK